MSQVVIYPRGFLGYDIGLPVRNEGISQSQAIQNINLNRKVAHRDRTVISNTEIEHLYKTLCQAAWIPNNLAFTERALRAALSCFGTRSFFDWCELQTQSAYFTDLHKQFLNDTFTFITTGQRRIMLQTWLATVDMKPAPPKLMHHDYAYRQYFKMEQAALLRRPFGVKDTVQAWCSQPGGLEDMITTLHILFGDTN